MNSAQRNAQRNAERLRIARDWFQKAKKLEVKFVGRHLRRLDNAISSTLGGGPSLSGLFNDCYNSIQFNEDRSDLFINDTIIKDLIYAENPFLALLPKDPDPGWQSKQIMVPMVYGNQD